MWCETLPQVLIFFLASHFTSNIRIRTVGGERGTGKYIQILIFINLFIIYSQIQPNLDYSNKLISLTRYNLHKSSSSSPSFKQIIEVLCATQHFFIYRAGVDQHQSYVNSSCNQCFWNRTLSRTFCCLFVAPSLSSRHLSSLRTYTADCKLPWRNSEKGLR